ncbi:MAG: hypothetical protein U5M50_11045 [Sphingobium sp.]|nr:hypothetical protein [Sphingobium sp.]
MIAAPALAAPAGDKAIIAAWGQRAVALDTYSSLPFSETGFGYTPDEKACWDIIDAAEEMIRGTVAATPQGIVIQLLCAMTHSTAERKADDAATHGDLDALHAMDSDLDWDMRLILAAIRSLKAMEDRA